MVRVFSKTVGFYLVTRVCLTSGILTTNAEANSAGQTTSSLSLANSYLPTAAIGVFPKQRQHAVYVERKQEDGTEGVVYSGRKPLLAPGKTLSHFDGRSKVNGERESEVNSDRSEHAGRFSPGSVGRFLTEINRDYARSRILAPKTSTTSRPTFVERNRQGPEGSDHESSEHGLGRPGRIDFRPQDSGISSDSGTKKNRPSSRSREVKGGLKDTLFEGVVPGDVKVEALQGSKERLEEDEGQRILLERLLNKVIGLTPSEMNNFKHERAEGISGYGVQTEIRPASRSSVTKKELHDSLFRIVNAGDLKSYIVQQTKQFNPQENKDKSLAVEGQKEASDRSSYKVAEDSLTTHSRHLTNFPDHGSDINLDYELQSKILRQASRSPSEVQTHSKHFPYQAADSTNLKRYTLQHPTRPDPEELNKGQTTLESSRVDHQYEASKRSSYKIFEDHDLSTSSGSDPFAGGKLANFQRPKEYGSDLKEWDITNTIKALDRFLSGVLNDESYNVVQHPPTNPVLALVLSRYGRYVPGTRNPRYYSYMAVNNIHNNRPFGRYKLETDEEPSYG